MAGETKRRFSKFARRELHFRNVNERRKTDLTRRSTERRSGGSPERSYSRGITLEGVLGVDLMFV